MQQISYFILAAGLFYTEGVIAGQPSKGQWSGRTTKIKTTTTWTPITMSTTMPSAPVAACKTQTLCADYTNSCGMTYGGCYTSCPWEPAPTFTPPPCPSTTTTTPPITTTTSLTTVPACKTQTLCADYTNSCGQLYGGCYTSCPGDKTPTFTPPPCTTTTSTITTRTSTTTTCSSTHCETKTNECGMTYGGCYNVCPGYGQPTWAAPRCEPTYTTTKAATTHK